MLSIFFVIISTAPSNEKLHTFTRDMATVVMACKLTALQNRDLKVGSVEWVCSIAITLRSWTRGVRRKHDSSSLVPFVAARFEYKVSNFGKNFL